MFSRNSLGFAAAVGFVALMFGMLLNERIKMPNIKVAAEETAREEMRAGVDSDKAVVGAGTAVKVDRKNCREAFDSGVRSAANVMPTDEFALLCLEGIEVDGTIDKEGLARLREQANKDKEERLNKAASP